LHEAPQQHTCTTSTHCRWRCLFACILQLVLINVSDHFTRFKANGPDGAAPPTVMGCLLGSQDGRCVDVCNSFEMRFTQGEDGWQIDHPFLLKKQEQCECLPEQAYIT